MKDKLKLEDCCLTIEQAKELEELGVDLNDTMFSYVVGKVKTTKEAEDIKFHSKLIDKKVEKSYPTLSNTEMLEMLPNSAESVMLEIHYWKGWNVRYYGISEVQSISLRDVLFETIKYLKTNKLM